MRHDESVAVTATPSLVRWSAVFAGVVIGTGLLLLLGALWTALAFETGVEQIQANLGWFWAGSVIVALFAAGMLAGWLSGVPGALTGAFNGLATWGLIVLVSLMAGVPGALSAIGAGADPAVGLELPAGALWAGFASLIVGALAAGAGGVAGGLLTHPATVTVAGSAYDDDRDRRYDSEPRDHDRDRRYDSEPRDHDRDRRYDSEPRDDDRDRRYDSEPRDDDRRRDPATHPTGERVDTTPRSPADETAPRPDREPARTTEAPRDDARRR